MQVFHQIFLHLVRNIFAFQEGNIFAFQEANFVSTVKPMFSDVGDTNISTKGMIYLGKMLLHLFAMFIKLFYYINQIVLIFVWFCTVIDHRWKCTHNMRNELQLLTLCRRRHYLRFICIFKLVINIDCPIQLKNTFKLRFNIHQRNLRDKTLLDLPTVKSAMGQSTFKCAAAKECNSLPSELRDITSLSPNIQFILILQMLLYFFVLYMP